MATFISSSAEQTGELGRDFAAEVQNGAVIALVGELGAGKTQFVKGLVSGLGSEVDVTSPTFTIVHEYGGGRLPVYHFDFFRLEDRHSAERLGLDDYFFGDGVSVVEWADKFRELIPGDARWIFFSATSESERSIEVR